MKEEEAIKKWCPFVRVALGPDNVTWQGMEYTNRLSPTGDKGTNCIGSDCMAWQNGRARNEGGCGLCGAREGD